MGKIAAATSTEDDSVISGKYQIYRGIEPRVNLSNQTSESSCINGK